MRLAGHDGSHERDSGSRQVLTRRPSVVGRMRMKKSNPRDEKNQRGTTRTQ
ncbi:hypothetical protein AX27061_4531 [Achromobacter xylosoxidans NBRC 15126 = ATCC 27061]|nr:hypothetical protein AX27061_4531 [Achromobacter xylosoxidans NBRC 15126 = ATCC 27061]